MSIVAAVEEPTATAVAVGTAFALMLGIPLASWAGVFRPTNVAGPTRWNAGDRLPGMFLVTVVGLVAWFIASQAVLAAAISTGGNGAAPTTQVLDRLSANDWATLATVPGLMALAALVGGDLLLGRGTIGRLGYDGPALWQGPWPAIVGIVVFIPFVFALSAVVELVYRLVGYEHPEAHDMLLKMSESPGGWSRWGLLLGAVVVAPLFEEMLFRGHLQTLLAAGFDKLADRSKPTPQPEVEAGRSSGFPVVGLPQEAAIPYAQRDPVAWPRWAAILVAALLFTAVHAAWTAPPIFLLAVAMGYAYERTGNLWVSIMMHALFNGMSTAIYLNMPK